MPQDSDTNQTPQNPPNPLQDVLASRYNSAYGSFLESTKIHSDSPTEIAKNLARLDPETFKKVTKQLAKTKKGAQSVLINGTPISLPTKTIDQLKASIFNKSLEKDFKYNQNVIQDQIDAAQSGILGGIAGTNSQRQAAQNLREIFGIKEKKKKPTAKKEAVKKENPPNRQSETKNTSPEPEESDTSTTPSLAKEEPSQTLKQAKTLTQPAATQTVKIPVPPPVVKPNVNNTIKLPQANIGKTVRITPATKGNTLKIPSTKGKTVRIPSTTKGSTVKIPSPTKGGTVRTGPTGTLRTGPKGTLRTSGSIDIEQQSNVQTQAVNSNNQTTPQTNQNQTAPTNISASAQAKTQSKISQQSDNQSLNKTSEISNSLANNSRQSQRQTFRINKSSPAPQTKPTNKAPPQSPAKSSNQTVSGTLSQQSHRQLIQEAENSPAVQELKKVWKVTPLSIQKELLASKHLANPVQKTQGRILQNMVDSGILEMSPQEQRVQPATIDKQKARLRVLAILHQAENGPDQKIFQSLADSEAIPQETQEQAKEKLVELEQDQNKPLTQKIPTGTASASPISTRPEKKSAKQQLGPKIGSPIGPAMQLDAARQQARNTNQDEGVSGDTKMMDTYEQGLSDQGFQGPAILGSGITMPEHGLNKQASAPASIAQEESNAETEKQGGFMQTSEQARYQELSKQQNAARLKEMSYPGADYQAPNQKAVSKKAQSAKTQTQKPTNRQPSITSREGFETFAAGLMMQQQATSKKFKAVQAAQRIQANIQSVQKIQKNLQMVWRVVNGAELLAGESGVTLVMWFFTANLQLINKVTFKVPFIPPATLVEDALTIFIDFVLMLFFMIILAFLIIVIAIIAIPLAVQVNLLGNTFDFLGISRALGF